MKDMNLIRKNIAANFTGNIWQALMSLIFVPFYIRFLGVEAYGLVGIFVMMLSIFAVLDLGLSATLTREMAHLVVLPGKKQEMRDLVRSLEIIYWAKAFFIGALILVLSPLIANHWVKASTLSSGEITAAIGIMGFVIAFQWLAYFYSGGLIGLQKQVLLNGINIVMSTLGGAGAVLILWLVSPTVQAFFLWQIVVSIAKTGLLIFFLWNTLADSGHKASFNRNLLAGVWKFAAGMGGSSVFATILTQMDKIILSRMLTLEMFGYYSLAGVVAMALYRVVTPIFSAVYPRLTELASLADHEGLRAFYHKSCQFMSVMILPVAAVIAMFSYELLFLWTGEHDTAQQAFILVSILICGTALNGLMNIPYGLQLAHKWAKLMLYINAAGVIILAPAIIFLTELYGAAGGATAWVILNVGYIIFVIPIMHRRILPGEKWHWYKKDLGVPLIASFCIAGLGRLFMDVRMSQFLKILYISAVSFSTLAAAAMATDTTRDWILKKFRLKFVWK